MTGIPLLRPLQLKEANCRSERMTAIKLSDYPGQEPSVCLLQCPVVSQYSMLYWYTSKYDGPSLQLSSS